MTSNPWIKTLTLAAAAGAMVSLVILTRTSDKPFVGSNDQGAPLAPDLTDPQKIVSLEVIGWDEQGARPRAFKVAFENNHWVIPSAFNYPVDATQNMAAAASSFVGALRERVVTDQASEHARLGLIAPDDITTAANTGRGTRVTMRDAAGKTVADLIIGGPVMEADTSGAPPAKRYVREAGKNRVYTTKLNQAYSTRLTDWVQTDLLAVAPDQIQKVSIDRYHIDEKKGTIVDAKSVTLTRPAPPAQPPNPQQPPAPQDWSISSSEGPIPAGAKINQQRVDDMLSAINQLKIVGVRPKPENLVRIMSGSSGEGKISPGDQMNLQRHGFFITSGGVLVANEGGMSVQCNDGVVYTLWFGELATDEATKDQAAGATPDAKAKTPDGRYMMVTVNFDDKLFGNPPAKSAELADLEAQSAAATAEKPLSDDQKARLTNLQAAHKAVTDGYVAKVKAGMDRQEKLSKRFAGWYYVVDATSLAKIRPGREELLAPSAPAAATPPAQPPAVIPTPGQ